jgi:SnoaL-like domain
MAIARIIGIVRILLLAVWLVGCGAPPLQPVAQPFDARLAEHDVNAALDDFHDAATHSDEERYFSHFAKTGIFLGTDETERWDVPAFRAYAHPHFSTGKGWVFHPVERKVAFSGDGNTAWFDERLRGNKLGAARGSGVFVRENGHYLIAQYNLSLTIPNDKFGAVHALLEPPAPADLHTRYKAAYEQATTAATKGDLAAAHDLLAAFADEASQHVDDDLAFWIHNQLTWIAWGRGDLEGALHEVEAAKLFLDRVTLGADKVRALRLHELWDRAYLLLEAKKAGAEEARAHYEELAKTANDLDGMAVLRAYFASNKHDGKTAMIAALLVDVDKDSDLQDLYVISNAFEAGGDHDHAAKVRARICTGRVYLMKPLIVRQLAREGHPCP